MLVYSRMTCGSCLLEVASASLTRADELAELAELTAGKVSRSISLPTWPVYDLAVTSEDAQMSKHLC